jgi:hypothetical protein
MRELHHDDHRREDKQQPHADNHYDKKKLAHLPLTPGDRHEFTQSGSISTSASVDLN